MKKYISPLIIGIVGVLVCAGLLIYQITVLEKENEDLKNGVEPENKNEPETIKTDEQPGQAGEQTV